MGLLTESLPLATGSQSLRAGCGFNISSLAAGSSAAGSSLAAAVAAVASAQREALLGLVVLAEALCSLRALASWQLPAADAARLRVHLIPEVHTTRRGALIFNSCTKPQWSVPVQCGKCYLPASLPASLPELGSGS